MGNELREFGRSEKWSHGAEHDVRHIAREVSGPLCVAVAAQCAYEEPLVAEAFRTGGPLCCDMAECGIGKPVVEESSACDVEDLRKDIWSNKIIASELQKNCFEAEFHQLVMGDAQRGWMWGTAKAFEAFLHARAVPGSGCSKG